MARIAVIGKGTIGAHLAKVAFSYGHHPALIASSKKIERPGEDPFHFGSGASPRLMAQTVARVCEESQVRYALLAIPSGGDGLAEAYYIRELVERGIKVVTAGKSALANQFHLVEDVLGSVRFDATVGGDVRMPAFCKLFLHPDPNHPFVITAVMNGTLNYAQSCVRDGVSREQICSEAQRLGFAEPQPGGGLTPLEMYRSEFSDVSRKIAILFNTRLKQLTGMRTNEEDVAASEFTEDDLDVVMADNSCYRYLVRICSRERDLAYFNDIKIGGMIRDRVGDLYVAAGFVKLEGSLQSWVPNHVGNAIRLVQNGVPMMWSGQGAGPVPTVDAMIGNLRELVEADQDE